MANKRKITTAIAASATALALLLGGTFAWTSISQQAKNETIVDINPGGRLHDDFNGRNKDVYVENFGDDDTGVPIFARIRLDQYLEIGPDAGKKDTADGETREVRPIIGGDINKVETWETYKPVDANGNFITVGTNPLTANDNWQWNLGNDADNLPYYMPTFNKNKDSLKADINGTYEGKIPDDPNHYDDNVVYKAGDTHTADAIYDWDEDTDEDYATEAPDENSPIDSGDVLKKEETHNATPISTTATVITMAQYLEWLNDDDPNNDIGPYWVYDKDGWAYWAQPIEPETTTGLLLDSITMNKTPDDNWYYGINVVGQFATASDWEMFYTPDGQPDGEKMTDDAKLLMEKITGKPRKETTYALLTANETTTYNTDGTTYTLTFVSRTKENMPIVGSEYEGATIHSVYENVGEHAYTAVEKVPWYEYSKAITTVNIAEEIQPKYTDYWFAYMTNLATVEGSDKLDTSKVVSMFRMFDCCNNLVELDVSTWDTSNVTTMFRLFTDCNNLAELDVSNWDTSKVTKMNGLFTNCQALKELAVNNWNVGNVTDMHIMLAGLNGVTQLDLSNWNVANVGNMNGLFNNNFNLTTVGDLDNWNVSNVTNMTLMFNNCNVLTNVGKLDNWDVSNVTNMSSMFKNCKALTTVGDISGWDVSNVTTMNGMFKFCENLGSVGDLSGWDVGNVTDMHSMFTDCKKLEVLDLSGWKTTKITTTSTMFSGCEALTTLNLANWDLSNVTHVDQMFDGCTVLSNLTLTNWDTKNIQTMHKMFYGCAALTDIDGIENWNVGNVKDMSYMFTNCTRLTQLTLDKWDVGNVDTFFSMFFTCSSLTSVGDISGWNVEGATNMNQMFYKCALLDVDCSAWTVGEAATYSDFNLEAPNVIAPSAWNTATTTAETPAA